MEDEASEVVRFFDNQTVFLTGATGFVGKIILEKLLRLCPNVKIYILIRAKKGKGPYERFRDILALPCFDRVRSEAKDDFAKRVVLVHQGNTQSQLHKNGSTQRQLQQNGSTQSELHRNGSTQSELHQNGSTQSELHRNGSTQSQLRQNGTTPSQLNQNGNTQSQEGSYTQNQLYQEGSTQSQLDLDPTVISELIDQVTVVIHSAANVKFDQSLKAAALNLTITRSLLQLAKQMPKLKAFVHISTAYSNCVHLHIREDFYEPPMDPDKLLTLLDAIDEKRAEEITPNLLKDWPNTYVFMKAIIEDLVRKEKDGLPLIIVRPGMVTCALEEPLKGWVDNFYGTIGLVCAGAIGALRTAYGKSYSLAHNVPVDYVTNIILASAWYLSEKDRSFKIYNYVGSKSNMITLAEFLEKTYPVRWRYTTMKQFWYFTYTLRENWYWHRCCIFLYHTVPAFLVDCVLVLVGRKPFAITEYSRLNKLLEKLEYFTERLWTFDTDNCTNLWRSMKVLDRKLYPFNMDHLDWGQYVSDSILGGRIYLFKDPVETIPKAKVKLVFLMVLHFALKALFWYYLFRFVRYLLVSWLL